MRFTHWILQRVQHVNYSWWSCRRSRSDSGTSQAILGCNTEACAFKASIRVALAQETVRPEGRGTLPTQMQSDSSPCTPCRMADECPT